MNRTEFENLKPVVHMYDNLKVMTHNLSLDNPTDYIELQFLHEDGDIHRIPLVMISDLLELVERTKLRLKTEIEKTGLLLD